MLTRSTLIRGLVSTVFCCAASFGQEKPTAPTTPPVVEFPVVLEQSVTAGKTPAGTKIQAKLAVSTLMQGTVIPRNAIFSGEVTESSARTKSDPSRLTVRMDSVQWKNGSASVKVYLTSWYYPAREDTGQNLQYGPPQPASRTWNGQGQYPDENSAAYHPFPGRDSGQGTAVPDTPSASTSNHRVRMKNVATFRGNDGALAIANSHSNIKLDKLTTYVLAAEEPSPAK